MKDSEMQDKAGTMLDKAREKVESILTKYEAYGFAYFDDIPMRFVMSKCAGTEYESFATFELNEDAQFITHFNWSKKLETPDYEEVKSAVFEYMVVFTANCAISITLTGGVPETKRGGRITEIW